MSYQNHVDNLGIYTTAWRFPDKLENLNEKKTILNNVLASIGLPYAYTLSGTTWMNHAEYNSGTFSYYYINLNDGSKGKTTAGTTSYNGRSVHIF